MIFGWSVGPNFDYAAQETGQWYGFAGPFTTLTGGGGEPPVSLADSFTGMTIIGQREVVPEPSSVGLLALGFWTVLALRARRV